MGLLVLNNAPSLGYLLALCADYSSTLRSLRTEIDPVFRLVAIDLDKIVLHVLFLTNAPCFLQLFYLFVESFDSSLRISRLGQYLPNLKLLVKFTSNQLARLWIDFTIRTVVLHHFFLGEECSEAELAAIFGEKLSVEGVRMPGILVNIMNSHLPGQHALIKGFKRSELHRFLKFVIVAVGPQLVIKVNIRMRVGVAD